MKINWVDILIVIYIIRAFFLGKKRGLGAELVALIAAILAWVISLHFYQALGDSLSRWFLLKPPTGKTIAFTAISIVILLIGLLIGRLLKKVMKLSFIPNIEKIGGCIFGVTRGISITGIIIVCLSISPAQFIQQEAYINSFFGNYLVALSPKVHGWILRNHSNDSNSFDVNEFWSELPERPKEKVL